MIKTLRASNTVPHNGSILVIEDSLVFSKALKKGLQALNYTVSVAPTLHKAMDLLLAHSFDLIVLDLNLPDGEGEMILQNLSILEKLKIIVYTSDVDRDRRNEWFRYGVLSYLSKTDPFIFVIQEIDTVMKSLLENTLYSILVIDDSKFICNQINSLLQPRNYRLSIANTSQEAHAFLHVKQFDLIILDLELPDMHGKEILKHIRKQHTSLETPVFILTGQYNHNTVGELLKHGANEFFTKPFLAEELLYKIDFWINIKRIQKEKQKEERLLKEYKNAIDNSTIVSKTNAQGIITYANEQFCTISGYSSSELIGKSHNLVRHPDTPKEVFQELWSTLKQGKMWNGVIKNRKKDGSPYWVNAYIHPIFDLEGKISEYIAIRSDITQIHILKENLRRALKISDSNFDEAYHRSKQYEIAINESNSVVRVNTEGKIVFVNELFCEISGYQEEEILDKPFNSFYVHDMDENTVQHLVETIQEGKIWKGVLKNRRKDGSIYWVKATIVPIKNSQGAISEYMSIRSDITEVIELHEEIESTQQEIIYHMGEIAESRSQETGNHVRRVSEYAHLLALKYGLDAKESNLIAMASPMHDIGKVGISDAILHKPGKLSAEEWEQMKTHTSLGYAVLKHAKRPILQASATIAKEHHEKYNGTGYPLGLKGQEIHLYARIVAIADVFDALSHDRCYKKAWSDEAIFELFETERGEHFDPELVDIFLSNKDEFLRIRNQLKDTLTLSH